MKKRFFYFGSWALVGVAALVVSGCNQLEMQAPDKLVQSNFADPRVAATPVPTPTPDPLQKFRDAHAIPAWAQGRVITDVPVKPGDKPIALTFDDGPWPEYTDQILQILAEHNAKATFYMVGEVVQSYPKIALRVRDAGHAIGGHSWSHPSRPRDPVAQVQRCDAQIKKVAGFEPTTFRPPYGALKNGMAKQAIKEKQAVLMWSADSNDWRKPSSDRIVRTILNQATPGGVVLFHDGGGQRSSTVAALPVILRDLKARGYRFVTVPQLLKLRHIPKAKPKPTPKNAPAKPAKAPSAKPL